LAVSSRAGSPCHDRLSSRQRQLKAESAAHADLTLHAHLSLQLSHDAPDDRKPQAVPHGLYLVEPLKGREQPFLLPRRQAVAALRRCRYYDAEDAWRWEIERELAEMRARLRKPLTPGRLEECLGAAAEAGLNKIKLYYIVGAPGEAEGDVAAVGEELAGLKRRFKSLTFEARVNPLAPKPGTAFAGAPLIPRPEYRERLRSIKARARGVSVVGGSWREAKLQADLGRADRSVARWIARVAER